MVTEFGGPWTMVRVAVPETFPDFAMMVTLPALTPVTTPDEETVALPVLLLVQVAFEEVLAPLVKVPPDIVPVVVRPPVIRLFVIGAVVIRPPKIIVELAVEPLMVWPLASLSTAISVFGVPPWAVVPSIMVLPLGAVTETVATGP